METQKPFPSSAKPVAMNDHQPPQPPQFILFPTAPEILTQTNTFIFSTRNNLLMLLLLSLYLLSLRANVEMSTHFFTSYIDDDPSKKSLFDPANGPPNFTSPTSTITTAIEEDDSFDHQFGFSNFLSDNGIMASETARSTAKKTSYFINDSAANQTYFQSFLKKFNLEHHEFTALIIFILACAASCWFTIHVFFATNINVHGVIFVLVLNDFCDIRNSLEDTFQTGSLLDSNRFSRVNAIRIVVRGFYIQLLNAWFFKEIDGSSFLLKIAARSIFMPFSIMAPWDWVKGIEKEINSFVIACFLLDMLMSIVFAMGGWIVMADPRMNVKDVVQEGCHLVMLQIKPAIELKCYECIACSTFARWVLTQLFGNLFALALQSFMEVYFIVAWMVYYLSVKSTDATLRGQPFGQEELEAMLEVLGDN